MGSFTEIPVDGVSVSSRFRQYSDIIFFSDYFEVHLSFASLLILGKNRSTGC